MERSAKMHQESARSGRTKANRVLYKYKNPDKGQGVTARRAAPADYLTTVGADPFLVIDEPLFGLILVSEGPAVPGLVCAQRAVVGFSED